MKNDIETNLEKMASALHFGAPEELWGTLRRIRNSPRAVQDGAKNQGRVSEALFTVLGALGFACLGILPFLT